ncbi:hypothetical protein, partial [Klebsiella variicola]|uniref:hypothetical protein n=1 Tax=Klebsiella variicola TaxID=244366 RepID=UPI002554AD27
NIRTKAITTVPTRTNFILLENMPACCHVLKMNDPNKTITQATKKALSFMLFIVSNFQSAEKIIDIAKPSKTIPTKQYQ